MIALGDMADRRPIWTVARTLVARVPMATRGSSCRLAVACVLLMVALAAAPSGARATTVMAGGQFTSATVDPNWTQANFAGSVSRTDCAVGNSQCNWIAIITAQPSLPAYACAGSDWSDASSDHNIRIVWSSVAQHANATVPFNVTGAPVLQGVYGQRLCLTVVYDDWYPDPVCVAQQPIVGGDCPPVNHPGTATVVATRLLAVQPNSPPTAGPPAATSPPATPPTATSPPPATSPPIIPQPTNSSAPIAAPVVRCHVPALVRKPLAGAKKALRHAHCVLGRVTRKHSAKVRAGRVISQSRRRGTVLKRGTPINLVASLGRVARRCPTNHVRRSVGHRCAK